jgi:hypothetical protein
VPVRGFCSRCGREIGGFLKPRLWMCPKCRMVICDGCLPEKRVGLVFKKPVCPDCLLELAEGGFYVTGARRP